MSNQLSTRETDSATYSLIIVGAGGFARELHGWLPEMFSPKEFSFKGYLGRQQDAHPQSPPLAQSHEYIPADRDRFLLAIGDLSSRRDAAETLLQKGAKFASFIHPTSLIAPHVEIGLGAIIYPYAIVSHGARVGQFVHLSLYASVGHDARLGENCYLSPYATLNGESRIGDDVFLGSHATVGPRVSIGDRVTIAANSCALRDVPDDSFVFGVPGACTSRVPMDQKD